MAIAFRFRWVPFFAALLVALIGVSLGQWQMGRAGEKEAIEKQLLERESAPIIELSVPSPPIERIEYRHVIVKGEFVKNWPVYLDNRPHNGQAGFYLLMPMKIAGTSQHVLVARGWLPRNRTDRQKIAPTATVEGITEIQGVVRRSAGHVLQLGDPAMLQPGAIVQNVDIGELALASNLVLHPFIVEQTSDNGDGLVRAWPRPSLGVDKHLGYAFQWYALAATALIFFLVTGFRHGPKQATE